MGTLKVPLFVESKEIFKLLQTLPNSGTRNLEQLEHLGELRHVFHIAHHSRYEYLVLQLCLIHFFKKDAKARGLSSAIKISDATTVSSGEELLKSWAILCENGHLYGIYEAERFWLGIFVRDEPIRKRFLSLFEGEAQQYAQRVIDNEQLNWFYRILSWLFLSRIERRTKDTNKKAVLNRSTEILAALFRDAPAGSALRRCQEMFSRVRRLSYLYLDLARLPVELQFNSPIIFQDFRKHPEDYVGSNEAQFQKLSDALQNMLVERIYASESASAYKLERMIVQSEHLRKRKTKEGANWFLSSPKSIEDHLQHVKGNPFTEQEGNPARWKHFLRLRFHPTEYFAPTPCLPYTDEDRFKKAVKSQRWKILFTPYQHVTTHGYILDVFEDPSKKEHVEGLVLKAVLEHISNHFDHWRKPFGTYVTSLVDPAISEVVAACFRRILPADTQVQIPIELCHDGIRAQVLRTQKERLAWSKSASWAAKRAKFSPDRQ